MFKESNDRIEHPNLSILPPLKSLSVLDIDEYAYLWETGILIGKSIHTLRELRIGMASYLSGPDGWASSKMIDHIGSMGVIGAITFMIYVCCDKTGVPKFRSSESFSRVKSEVLKTTTQDNIGFLNPILVFSYLLESSSYKTEGLISQCNGLEDMPRLHDLQTPKSHETKLEPFDDLPSARNLNETLRQSSDETLNRRPEHTTLCEHRLCLEVLEIERVPLTICVLLATIDWSVMSSLTLLRCGSHEQLWKALRTEYAPYPTSSTTLEVPSPKSAKLSKPKSCGISSDFHPTSPLVYPLNLKKIHTDAVSPCLISFLNETLAPNSLEWLFLQDGRQYVSQVTLDTIHRGPIRRHRASIKKLMVDSAIGKSNKTHNQKREKWMFNRELLKFITSGKMCHLKELTMAIDYKDWVSNN